MIRSAASLAALLHIFTPLAGHAQPDASRLTLERIFGSDELSAQRFSVEWEESGASWTRVETSDGPAGGRAIVRHDAISGEREVLVPGEDLVPPGSERPLAIDGFAFSKDRSKVLVYTNSKRVWRYATRGDYWVLDRSSRELRRVGGEAPASTLMFAKMSPGGERVAYVHERDLWVDDLRSGETTRLTRRDTEHTINGTFDWVYEEELSLRDGYRWSPDGTRIAYWQLDTEGVRRFPLVDHLSGLYPEVRWFAYPKVGETNSACRVGVMPSTGGETVWIDVPGDPRNHYVARMEWLPDGRLLLQQLDRRQQTLRVYVADASTGGARAVLTERDDAWVEVVDDVRVVRDGRHFTWLSESDGWRHLWSVALDGSGRTLLTRGEHDVIDVVHVSDDARDVWYIASPEEPSRRYLFHSRDGRTTRRVTPGDSPGSHSYRVSPDGRLAVHSYSTIDSPPSIDLVRLPSHERVRVLEDNAPLRKRLDALARQPTEFLRVDIGDGVELEGWRIRPPDLDESRKYPLLVYVYGEPAGQTVRDRWSGSSYLWHLLLAQRGYVVMSFDNRGTPSPRGRAWRKAVYRRVGILAPKEQAAAVRRVLADSPWLDADRVGVWGWSGGGSMSLNAVFRYPELYHTAMAVAPVPNQRLYDTIYQERYMGLPSENVEGFLDGSPITHAHRLEGNLLIVHGTGDDNCHYQGVAKLVDELIRHDKAFTVMPYPNRTHSIREGVNTTLHLRKLLTRYLETHLPAGAEVR